MLAAAGASRLENAVEDRQIGLVLVPVVAYGDVEEDGARVFVDREKDRIASETASLVL